jgi:hypothetical protein
VLDSGPPPTWRDQAALILGERDRYHAQQRDDQLYASTSTLPFSNLLAVLAEHVHARTFGGLNDLRNRPGGDGRIDIWLLLWSRRHRCPLWIATDVKATDAAGDYCDWLLVQADKLAPNVIYFHASMNPWTGLFEDLGCVTAEELASRQAVLWPHHYRNFVCRRDELHSMDAILRRYLGQWRWNGWHRPYQATYPPDQSIYDEVPELRSG